MSTVKLTGDFEKDFDDIKIKLGEVYGPSITFLFHETGEGVKAAAGMTGDFVEEHLTKDMFLKLSDMVKGEDGAIEAKSPHAQKLLDKLKGKSVLSLEEKLEAMLTPAFDSFRKEFGNDVSCVVIVEASTFKGGKIMCMANIHKKSDVLTTAAVEKIGLMLQEGKTVMNFKRSQREE